MRTIYILLLLVNTLFAVSIEVKRGDIVVSIESENKILKKNQVLSLSSGNTICVIEGKGQLVINNEVKISTKSRNKCYTNSNPNNIENQDIISQAKEFLDSSEDSVSGMSRHFKKPSD